MTLKNKLCFIFTLILICFVSFIEFTFLYFIDNKYMDKTTIYYGHNGQIDLSNNNFNDNSVIQLCYNWDVYPNEYIPYNKIHSKEAPLNIFIGQYSGLDFGNKNSSYFGKATYHLKIMLPENVQLYTLELPEIFSSYQLYINGNLLSQCGNIYNRNYHGSTKSSSVSFLAKDCVDITLYVANYSNIYGGLVYPPAFGSQDGVSKLLITRIIFRCMVLFIILTLCILFFFVGMKAHKIYFVYSLLALIFIGYSSYPITHWLFTTGIWVYHLERFCSYFFILLILYIHNKIFDIENENILTFKRQGKKQIILKLLFSFSIIILLLTLVPAKIICINQTTLKLYSSLLSFYKCSIFLYLIITTFSAVFNNIKYSMLLLSGFCVVATSFLADRIYKLFEPIHFSWFYEISGFILIFIIGIILMLTFSDIYIKNKKLNTQIEMQKSYYSLVTENIYNTRKMRHNLKNHILVIKTFLEGNDFEKLKEYIENYAKELPSFKEMIFCENDAINVLISYYVNIAYEKEITVDIKNFNIPKNLNISNPDLCVLIGNLFTNAIEACEKIKSKDRIIKISAQKYSNQLSITFDNTYAIEPIIVDNNFLSLKRFNKEGIGIPSIKKLVSKYNGIIKFNLNTESEFFEVSILFPIC